MHLISSTLWIINRCDSLFHIFKQILKNVHNACFYFSVNCSLF
ncbi:hypothetical protein HMPREF0083_01897 [Aneurinibacillus aneurinilyticus ATCC 12856]|uniref:Uncharacterized protein n=1 Tax=Aneurinibacillus aneurinilyticus ATCC 12856 TaxID=649747 RepID=U1X5Z4_ANEAE|nr:hypothetical protein HMPREF0083_01897 [Aneurinibacillus aneurinilyticus ATCC 12856]